MSWPFILDELRDNAGRPDEPYPQNIWDMLYRAEMLVVDDFDKDIDSAWAQRQLYQGSESKIWLASADRVDG